MHTSVLVDDSLAAPVSFADEEAPGAELRVYVRDRDGSRSIRFISDGAAVEPSARIDDVSYFETQAEADLAASVCDNCLTQAGWAADGEGWHAVPASNPTLVATILGVARKVVWSSTGEPAPRQREAAEPLAPCAIEPAQLQPKEPRRWSRRKEARFAFKIGQGMSAKQVAMDPEIRSTEAACYQRARELGLSFREVATGQAPAVRWPSPLLQRFAKAAAQEGRTRDAKIEAWLRKVDADPGRYGTVAI